MSNQVFISYKAEEYQEASKVRAFLQEKGISCWMAPESIRGGSSYASEIPAAIRGCQAFVLILSARAQQSKWVPRELDQAINDGKVILPFMIENCELQDEFRFYLTNVQRYPAYEGYEQALERMTGEIRSLLGIEKETASDAAAPVEKQERIQVQKVPKQSRKPEKDCGKRQKKVLILGMAVALIIVLSIILHSVTTVKIAGERVSKSEDGLYIYQTELTEKDMASIAKMKKLNRISLENCVIPVTDLSSVVGETVTSLVLNGCNLSKEQVESIPFSQLALTRLEIAGNPGFDTLEVLKSSVATLETLCIDDTSVTEIGILAECSRLKQFSAGNNGIEDISPLSGCVKLQSLALNGNKIKDLSALDLCTELYKLEISGNELTSLDGLEHCLKLTEIKAADNQLSSVSGLENAVLLEVANLNGNQLRDVASLGKSAATLRKVYLSDNQITDLSFLGNCSELCNLAVDNNQITSLEPLKSARNLESLTAAGNQIETTEGIEGKENLRYVNLADNGMVHVGIKAPLSLVAAEGAVLDLSGNTLETLNVSYDKQFRLLALSQCGLEAPEILSAAKCSYVVFDYSEALDWERIAATESYEYGVVGCPLDQQVKVEQALGSYNTEFVDAPEAYYQIETFLPEYVTGAE